MPNYPIGYEPVGTVALLTNPRSGVGSARHATEIAIDRLHRRGVEAVAFNATTAEDTGRIIRRALEDLDFDAIVVCGGDGMIFKTLQEAAQTGIPIGIIPTGSGNDTARQLRIPFNPGQAADVIAEGFVTTSDLGHITDQHGESYYFSSVLACGIDARMAERASRMTWASGRKKFTFSFAYETLHLKTMRYVIEMEGAQHLPALPPKTLQRHLDLDGPISEDGKLTIDRDLLIATVGNTRSYGGGRLLVPRADHHDGLLDVTLAQHVSYPRHFKYVKRMLDGDHNDIDWIQSYRFRKAVFNVDLGDVPSYADGEQALHTPLVVECKPAACRFIVPAP